MLDSFGFKIPIRCSSEPIVYNVAKRKWKLVGEAFGVVAILGLRGYNKPELMVAWHTW